MNPSQCSCRAHIFCHNGEEVQGNVDHQGQMCSRCWCQSDIPSGNDCSRRLGLGVCNVLGVANICVFMECPSNALIGAGALELVAQRALGTGSLWAGQACAGTCSWRGLSSRMDLGTDLEAALNQIIFALKLKEGGRGVPTQHPFIKTKLSPETPPGYLHSQAKET